MKRFFHGWLCLVLFPASAAAQGWPMWRHDAQRTGLAPHEIGTATLADGASLVLGGRLDAGELLVDDVDRDGLPETVFARSGRVLALRVDGSLAWASEQLSAVRPLGTADFDGDGRPEVAVATSTPGVAVLDGTLGRTRLRTPPGEIASLGTLLPLDIEGDGATELYVADDGCTSDGHGSGRIYAFSADGDGRLRTQLRTETHDDWCGRNHVVADLDGDGRPEIVAPDEDRVWAYNPADGFSSFASDSIGSFPIGLVDVTAADLDGDGDDELVLASDNPWSWYATARRLVVLEASGDHLVLRWQELVDPESGRHRYLDDPVADVLPEAPGLEVVSSIADSASSGWEVRVFRGLPETGEPEVLARIPGVVALGLADVDGDGAAEVLVRPAADYVLVDGATSIAAVHIDPDGTPRTLWTVSSAWLPLLPDPDRSTSALPCAAPGGWGGPAQSLGLPGPGRFSALLVEQDGDGDGAPDRLVSLDGPSGVELDAWDSADPRLGPTGITALVRLDVGTDRLAAASDDGRVALLDGALALTDDGDGDGVPDVLASDRTPRSLTVDSGPDRGVVGTDAAGRTTAFAAACDATPSARCTADGRSGFRLAGAEEARVSLAVCDCSPSPLVVGPAVTSDGWTSVAALRGVADPAPLLVQAATQVEPQWDALPAGPLDPAWPAWDTVALALLEPGSGRSTIALLSPGAAAAMWTGLQADGSLGGPLSAADLDGDGTNELLAVRQGFMEVVSATGEEQARHDASGGGLVAALDIDGDAAPELFRSGADNAGPERLDRELQRVWIANEGVSHRGRYAALAGRRGEAWSVGAVAEGSAELSAYAAEDGALRWRTALAGGRSWPSEAEARRLGAHPGALSSPAATRDAFIVGSTDGWLYAVRVDSGELFAAVPLHAAVGEPVVAPVWERAEPRILAPTADGLVHVVGPATLAAPAAVFDGDGTADPTSAADDIDESHDASVAAAAWPAVDGADGYLVQLVTDDDVIVRPWSRVTEARSVARDAVLRPHVHYRTLVRAAAGAELSPETSSDGFEVLDDDPPWVEVVARPERILPDLDGIDDFTTAVATLEDGVLLLRQRVEVQDEGGRTVLELSRAETGRARLSLSVRWDGRNADGRVVEGGRYRIVAFAEDSAGRESRGDAPVWVCAGAALAEPECAVTGGDGDADAGADDAGATDVADAEPEGGPLVPGGGVGCTCTAATAGGSSGAPLLFLSSILLAALVPKRGRGRTARRRG